MGEITSQKGHFLTEDQKKVKGEMMRKMLLAFFEPLGEHKELFKDPETGPQAIIDLILSVLVMLNRDLLVHTFTTMKIEHDGSKIMRQLFETIRQEVTKKLKVGKYQ